MSNCYHSIKAGLTCILIFFSVQVFSQCYPGYERAEQLITKGKYVQARDVCNRTLRDCDLDYECAGALLCLAKIYRDHLANDSLYIDVRKKLVRLGFHYPQSYRTLFMDENGVAFEPPEVDLYITTRELCCELFERNQFDSALYYFVTFANKHRSLEWCGVGHEFDYIQEKIMLARLTWAATGSDSLLGTVIRELDNDFFAPLGFPIRQIAWCVFDLTVASRPGLKPGDLTSEMMEGISYKTLPNGNPGFSTTLASFPVYFPCLPSSVAVTDTLTWMQNSLERSELFSMIRYKEMITFFPEVTITGFLFDMGNGVAIYAYDDYLYLEGVVALDEIYRSREVKVTGTLRTIPRDRGTLIWNHNSLLLYPEKSQKRILEHPMIEFIR